MLYISTEKDDFGYPRYPNEFYVIQKKFNAVVTVVNVMTPFVMGYFEKGNIIAEISGAEMKHEYMTGTKLFGVTVVKNGVKDSELSTAFTSLADVKSYLAAIV